MSLERRATRELWLAAMAAVALVLPTVVHFDNTQRVMAALLTKKTSCADGIEPNDPHYPFDAIAVPGAGVSLALDGTYLPTGDGQTRLRAVAIAFPNGVAPRIILLDGVGKEGISEAYLRRAMELNGGFKIPIGTIFVENNSTNTATNMKELRRIVDEHHIKKVAIVTNMYHGLRSVLLSCANGVASSLLPAEDLLSEESRSVSVAVRFKEKVGILSQLWNPAGEFQTELGRFKSNFPTPIR